MAEIGETLTAKLPQKVVIDVAEYLERDENALSLAFSGLAPELAPLCGQKR